QSRRLERDSTAGRRRARRRSLQDRHCSAVLGLYPTTLLLFHEDPLRSCQREGDETDDGGGGHEQRIANLPAEQDNEAADAHEGREPVADRDLPQEDAGAEYRADGGGVGALDESLDIRVLTVTHHDRRNDEDEQERRQEDADGRSQRPPEAVEQ